jgi:NADH-quinone oxidoreductase subunit M
VTFAGLPWLELALLTCLVGFVAALLSRASMMWTVLTCAVALVCATNEWVCHHAGWVLSPGPRQIEYLAVDGFSAPLLPLVTLLHLLTALSTPNAEGSRGFFARLLASLAIQLATFGCTQPWLLIALLAAGPLVPTTELLRRGREGRAFALHMVLFTVLLVGGWAVVTTGWSVVGGAMMLGAILVRSGTVPVHSWVPALFEHGKFGTALVFVAPLVAVYAAVRLVVPTAPDWVLKGMGAFSMLTTLYAAGLAVVQKESRRLLAYLLIGHGAMVLVGLELLTPVSLTGSLSLWVAGSQALAGLGLVLRAVEARFGRLKLNAYLGLYSQSPALAASFLLMGLAAVGFPGTPGFISGELLIDGVVTENMGIGLLVVLAGLLNGVAVLRAYFLLFTGTRHESAVPLGVTLRERFAIVVLSLLLLLGGLLPQHGIASRYAAARQVLATRGQGDQVADAHP